MEWWNIYLERKFPFIHSYVKKSLSKKPLCHHSIFPMMARLAVFGRLDESNNAKWIVCLLDKAFRKK